ncbi:MAG: hypothetical protein U0354_20305, partial [Candidatus Sericytochromatia bacterium]
SIVLVIDTPIKLIQIVMFTLAMLFFLAKDNLSKIIPEHERRLKFENNYLNICIFIILMFLSYSSLVVLFS